MLCPEIPLCHSLSLSVKLLFPLAFLSKYLKTKLLENPPASSLRDAAAKDKFKRKTFFSIFVPELLGAGLPGPLLVITNLSPLVLQWHWRTGYPVERTGAVITTMPARRRELQRSRYPRGSCFFRWVRARHVLPADIHLFYCTLLQ